MRNPRSAANDPEPEVAQLKRELCEALDQQAATSEVLQVISSSPGDLEPVFEHMLEKAVQICDATFGNIYRWDGDALQLVATHNTPPAYAEHRRHSPFRANQDNAVARMIKSKAVVHVFDVAASETYTHRCDPTVVAAVELGRIRSALVVPMLKDEELVGAFTVSRQEVRPFTDKQCPGSHSNRECSPPRRTATENRRTGAVLRTGPTTGNPVGDSGTTT